MSMVRHIAIALLAVLTTVLLPAQGDPLVEALRSYQAGDLTKAREHIDKAVRTTEHAEDPEAWLVRGYVYKDLFKDLSSGNEAEIIRDEAVGSLFTSLTFDTDGTYRENALQAYDYLTRTYFNDAAKALNELNDQRALAFFAKYKESVLRVDPKAPLKAREVEFNNALGTVYTKRFNQDRSQTELFERAIVAFRAVLAQEPENYGANYNLATLYYNRGVFNIRSIDADSDIPNIQQIQEVSREYFQLALPYMLKAHDMNPSRRETLLGLEGIYYSLQDEENSERFRQLFEELPPQDQDR
jgi:tetratricopeptide (TPR) repeat protein